MPWSCAAGMKWVPTSPLVVAPQIANPPASNQNGWVRAAPRRPSTALRAALPVRAGGVTISVPAVRRHAEVGGVVAQQEQHERYDGERTAGDHQRRGAPAVVVCEPGHQRAGR